MQILGRLTWAAAPSPTAGQALAERETALLGSLLDVSDSRERLVRRQVFDNHRRVLTEVADHLEERVLVEQSLGRAARASASAHVANLAGWLRNVLAGADGSTAS